MPDQVLPEAGARPADLQRADAWLAHHGLHDTRATPLLAARLTARRRARLAIHLTLAALILAASYARADDLVATGKAGGYQEHSLVPLVVLTVVTAGLLAVQSLSDWWVGRVDRRSAANLSRRATHPVPPGWRVLFGRPYAVFAVATFAGAGGLAVGALTGGDPTVRYGALVLLVGLLGAALGSVLRLRDLLRRPVVAEDETSLTADVIMRVEDARELATPTLPWMLPALLLFGTELGWWNAVSLIYTVGCAAALALIHKRAPSCVTVARQVMRTS